MTTARSKSELLSETTKTYIRSVAKQDFYGYDLELNNKYILKGINQEDDSINLLNSVNFTQYTKNTERLTNEWLTGEADIVTEDTIIDVKTSWSLDTFPATPEEGINKDYEWQLRAYLFLYDKPLAHLCYCMVSTQADLLNQYENLSLHRVDHIPAEKRITTITYERDLELEEEIKTRLYYCTEYYVKYINQLNNK